MTTQQLILSLVLATMVFSVALELRVEDFTRVAKTPRAVLCGLIPQFILLPVATWLATLVLDLPPNIEAAMILVAACPGGSLSNVVTHLGRGNSALSVSVSAVASVIALFATPFNFSWMIASKSYYFYSISITLQRRRVSAASSTMASASPHNGHRP